MEPRTTSAPPAGLRRLVAGFRATLPPETEERLRAVILFGSRARGDARPSSDWDLCAVWRGAPPRGLDAPVRHEGRRVDWIHLADDAYRAGCGRVGTLPRVVASFGVPIIEKERIDAPEDAKPTNQKDWNRHFENIRNAARAVLASVEESVRYGIFGKPQYETFEGSANFAERAVKLALDMQGVTADATRNMHRLARQWPENSRYRQRTRELNSEVEFEHKIPYHDMGAYGTRDTFRALERARRTFAYLKDVLEDPALGKRAVAHETLGSYAGQDAVETARINCRRWQHGVVAPLRRIAEGEAAEHSAGALEDAVRIGCVAEEIAAEIEARLREK